MFTSNISLITLVRGVGVKLSRLVYLVPHLGFGSGSVISQFLLHHNLGIFSCKRYKHYFSQTEMFTSNISLVTLVQGVGGKLSRLVYLAPRQGIGSGSVISQFLLHHNLGIFSCKRYKHYFSQTDVYIQRSVWLPLSEGWGASCPGWFILPPAKDLGRTVSSVHSYCNIILEYLVAKDVNIISAKLRHLHLTSVWLPLYEGWGASCPGWFILPPA